MCPLTARRPAPTVSRAYARTQVGRSSYITTPQCRPARVRPLKHLPLRPPNRRADHQPLRALPPRATSAVWRQTVRTASGQGESLPRTPRAAVSRKCNDLPP
jgi:hypothetical protein